jgi:hypothetical protein
MVAGFDGVVLVDSESQWDTGRDIQFVVHKGGLDRPGLGVDLGWASNVRGVR